MKETLHVHLIFLEGSFVPWDQIGGPAKSTNVRKEQIFQSVTRISFFIQANLRLCLGRLLIKAVLVCWQLSQRKQIMRSICNSMEPYILIKESMHKTHNKEKMKIKSHLGTWSLNDCSYQRTKEMKRKKYCTIMCNPAPKQDQPVAIACHDSRIKLRTYGNWIRSN